MPSSYRSICDDDCSDASSVSRISSSSSLVALPHEPSRATIVAPASPSTRLAVLLPSNLWKSDADASECDTLKCATKFSMFERRHHCRKCGGVFCSTCSARTTDLLDTSSMPFIIPPSSMPLYLLAASAPPGALVNARVCDDCYTSIHGARSPTRTLARSPLATETCIASSSQPKPTSSTASTSSALLPAFSPSSLSSTSSASLLASPLEGAALPPATRSTGSRHRSRRPLSRSNSATTVPQSPTVRRTSIYSTDSNRGTESTPKDLGVLESYPLKISSQGCKLTGAAVWSPRHIPHKYDAPHVVVAASLPHDEDDEQDNHCIRVNGEFQVRAPVQDAVISARPEWSTF